MYKKVITKLVFIILLYFFSTTSLFANVNSYKFAFNRSQNDLEETLFSININKLGSKDTVLGYINYSNNQVFLPLQEVFFLLGFTAYLINDNDLFNIEGTYFNYKFNINLNNDYIKTNITKNNNIPFTAFIINNSNEIFINTDYLANNFSLLLDINRADLSIVFKALNNKFADEILADAEKKRKALNSRSSATTHIAPITYSNRPTFWVNTLGVKYNIDYNKNIANNKHGYNQSVSLSTGGLMFGFDSNINFNYKANNNKYIYKSSYINFSRPFTNKYIKYVSLVDTTSLAINGVSKAQLQQGVYVSSLDDYGINADKTITIAGALPQDEEVELYKNNVLIDYSKGTNGSYSFTVTNVALGVNNFKLVFYDKYGNTREETKTYVINNDTLSKNNFSSKFSVTTNRTDVLENTNNSRSNNTNNKKYINANAQVSYGLGNTVNITSFYSLQQNPSYHNNNNIVNGTNNYSQQNIVGLSANVYLLGASIVNDVYYNTNNTQTGFNSNIYTAVLKGSLYAGINYYGNTQTQESYQSNSYNKYKITARYNNSLKFINLPFSFNYTSTKSNNANNYTNNTYNARISKSLIRYVFTSLSGKYNQTKSNTYNNNYINATLSNNYNYKGKFNYNNKLNFTLNKATKLQSIENALSYKFNNNHNAKLTFNSTLLGSKKYTHNAGIGYSGKYKFGLFGVNVSGSKNNFTASFSYSAALIYHTKRHKVFISPNINGSRQAKIIAFTYIDNNANNKYDNNIDVKLNNAGLMVNGSKLNNNYNANYSIIENVRAYSNNKIYLNEEALDDITLAPYYENDPVLAIPNATNFIDVPAKQSGNIYGVLYSGNQSLLAYYKIQLVESNNKGNIKVIATSFTNKNGEFAIETIPYGTYFITASTKDGKQLNTNSFSVKDFEVNENFYLK